MKIYLTPDTTSRGIMRVVDALTKYAPPSIQIVETPQEAELEVIHVWGRHHTVEKRVEALRKAGKPYAMIQYVLRSSMRPHTKDWIKMWEGAKVVWSYYHLPHLADQDLVSGDFNFYYAPLGVDTNVFNISSPVAGGHKRYVVLATSQHALSEGTRECAFATKEVGRKMLFIGHELRRGPDIVCKTNLTDQELAWDYSACQYVSGLRRCEGFEFPVIEGAMCGARPIVFDRPEMRQWFNDFAIFIGESDRETVIKSLVEIFKNPATEVSEREKNIIRDRFNWSRIINGFWKEII